MEIEGNISSEKLFKCMPFFLFSKGMTISYFNISGRMLRGGGEET